MYDRLCEIWVHVWPLGYLYSYGSVFYLSISVASESVCFFQIICIDHAGFSSDSPSLAEEFTIFPSTLILPYPDKRHVTKWDNFLSKPNTDENSKQLR